VDTQKGLIDIEVFDEGLVHELCIQPGEKVPVGTVMALIEDGSGSAAAPATGAAPVPAKQATGVIPVEKETPAEPHTQPAVSEEHVGHRIKASPLARSMAQEQGIDLATVRGTGEGGAITKQDVEHALAAQASPGMVKPETNAAQIRKAVAAAMSRSNRDIPHYYLDVQVDMSRALSWLHEANNKRDVKHRLLPVALLIKAVAKALKEVPDMNAWWVDGLQRKPDINIGFAVSLRGGGVMIPAIRDADKKSPDGMMEALQDIISRARDLKLRSSELGASTITVTNLGDNQADRVFGVIYPPQVAIVGFGSIREQPWAENGMLDVRPVMTISLAADHRATDGITGSRFLMAVESYLQKPESL
jgi:pyruvate dehydrogenase E2 component (dihydrolipoamide acetyltransferase)